MIIIIKTLIFILVLKMALLNFLPVKISKMMNIQILNDDSLDYLDNLITGEFLDLI